MRRTNSKETDRDWNYSDGFLAHAKILIGQHLLIAAPMEVDCKEASDLIFLVSGRGDVAFRVRRPHYMEQYPFDITFRSNREGFEKTELDKILEGKARWMLYGFGSEDRATLARWVLLNLDAFRAAMLRGLVKRDRARRDNGDGTGFEWFDVRILRGLDETIILASSHEIPIVVLPPKQPYESSRDFWAKRLKGGES
jgi:hypothetical protein